MIEEFNNKERKIADKVAKELLIKEKKQRLFVWLFLLIFVLLLSFFSSLVFSRIAYYGKSTQNYIQEGSILFSYEEGTNAINIVEALPTNDEIGKMLSKSNEYFQFRIAVDLTSNQQNSITYEISLTPKITTLDTKYIRVYLLEDSKEIKINNKSVNYYNELPNSTIREGSKMFYKTTVTEKSTKTYVFKMWVAQEYQLPEVSETFSCYVNVDSY